MPRHFAKKMYGPYFPYDHGRKHPDEEYQQKDLEIKIEKFWNKIISRFKKK